MECLPDDIEGSNACMGGLEDRARLSGLLGKLLETCGRFQECKSLARSSNTVNV
jgi:hypothetical protein